MHHIRNSNGDYLSYFDGDYPTWTRDDLEARGWAWASDAQEVIDKHKGLTHYDCQVT